MLSAKPATLLIAFLLCAGCLAVFIGLLNMGSVMRIHQSVLVENAELTAVGPDGTRHPVIARLIGQDRRITVIAGPNGPLYSAHRPSGELLVSYVPLPRLQERHPEIYNEITGAIAADKSLLIDASAGERSSPLHHEAAGLRSFELSVPPSGAVIEMFHGVEE